MNTSNKYVCDEEYVNSLLPPLVLQQDLSFDIGEEMQILRPMPVSKHWLLVTRMGHYDIDLSG